MKEVIQQIFLQVRAGWRYRWYAMMLAWLVAISGWFVVMTLPDKYEASARVYVDTDSMLRPLLRGLAVQTDFSQRIQLMTKTLLSRPNLEKIARETDLDIYAKTPKEQEKLLLKLSDAITFKSTRRQNLYTITYFNNDPKLAKDVVQALLTIFVETTLGDSRKDSDSAQRFLDTQIGQYERKLTEAENRLTEFKRKNIGALPGQGGNVFQRMQKAKEEYAQAQLTLREAAFRRDEIKRQLNEAKRTINTDRSVTEESLSPTDSRILLLQKKLDDLLLKYTELHPDVIEIRETITTLEKNKKQKKKKKDNIVAINTLYEQTKLELGKAQAELAGMRVRANEFKDRVTKLQSLVKILPQVETELKRLDRDYAINKKNYDGLVSRRESAKISESADSAGDNVKFKVIDPPRQPILPVGPKRLLLNIIILILSFVIGAGVAFFMSQLHPVIYDQNSLRRLTGLPVFGSVSRIWTPNLIFKRKVEVGVFIFSAIGLIGIFGLVLYLQNYSGTFELFQSLRRSV